MIRTAEINWDEVEMEFETDVEFAGRIVDQAFETEYKIIDEKWDPSELNVARKKEEALATRRAAFQVVLRALLEISMKHKLGLGDSARS